MKSVTRPKIASSPMFPSPPPITTPAPNASSGVRAAAIRPAPITTATGITCHGRSVLSTTWSGRSSICAHVLTLQSITASVTATAAMCSRRTGRESGMGSAASRPARLAVNRSSVHSAAVAGDAGAAVAVGGAGGVERGLALGDREAALVERLADDHAGEVDLAQRRERAEVLDVADPAGVEEAAAHGLGDLADVVEVRALEPAVAVDVGVDEARHAAVAEAPDGVAGRHLGGLRPAGGGDVAAADVDGDEHARAERLDHGVEEVDIAEGGSPDDHALRARPQRLADRGQAAQPAAV